MRIHKGVSVLKATDEDALASADILERADAHSPFRLFWEDVVVLLSNFAFMPYVFLPLGTAKPLPGVELHKSVLYRDYFVTFVITILELPLLLGIIPAILLLPGWTVILIYGAAIIVIWLLARTTWGDLKVESKVPLDPEKFKDEKWIFINGIATGRDALQTTVDMVSSTFKRPVVGVHNRSTGIIGDILECLVQRAFSYSTFDSRCAFQGIKLALEDPTNKKVVVIAHSQGGILVSMALDRLYTLLPTTTLQKLEIYTFGSAARSFHNPRLVISRSDSHSLPPTPDSPTATSKLATAPPAPTHIDGHLLAYIEHYCNGRDMVPRWGVLWRVAHESATTYSGRVFSHDRQTGHLFDQHYLEPMLPLARINDDSDSTMFLNHVCKLDPRARGVVRATTFHSHAHDQGVVGGDIQGPTVRQVSRLWRYVDGNSP